MKTLRTVYPYGLNEKTKFMNKDGPVGKLFPPLPRYGERFLEKRSRASITNRTISSDIEVFLKYVNTFPVRSRSNECRKLLESLKKKELKNIGLHVQNNLVQYDELKKRWYDLIEDSIFTKFYTKKSKEPSKIPKYMIPIYFDNKGLEFL